MSFLPCPACREPIFARDRVCPHCGAARESARRASAAIVVLGALTGCFPIGEPAYGIADSGTSDWGESSESASESMSTTDDGPFTSTTSPGTTQGTSPTPDPTNYTMGDESSSDAESSSTGGSSTDTTGDGSSDTSGEDSSSDTSGTDGSSSSSDDGGSSST